ncbi:MAG: putative beta-lysine N-acetyltransferase [Bacteroidales bacterium]|nr:putative beta-lysine N-acetyltransferase [Bacteroidales bacterium]
MQKNDIIEIVGKNTRIQHGKLNNRVYLMKLDKNDFPKIIDRINTLARDNRYTKIFAKVPYWAAPLFISSGFIVEAYIPKFYKGNEDVFFMSKYLSSDRLLDIEYDKLEELSKILSSGSYDIKRVKLQPKIEIIKLKEKFVDQITEIYKEVFESYPFPIHDPEYILKAMKDGVEYFGIMNKGKLLAVSSAEVDLAGSNAEMTDFATLPEHRGKRYSMILLNEMEKAMKKQGISMLYTIARLNSMAMNKTFLNLGYIYAGTLIKNTNIAGKIESMNVLYKAI